MKKFYETPTVEVVKFQYRDHVVVASGGHQTGCEWVWINTSPAGGSECGPDNKIHAWNN